MPIQTLTLPTGIELPQQDAVTTGTLSSSRLAVWATLLGIVALLLGDCIRMQADPDLWGHLQFGLVSLETGSIARVDPYSYTAQGNAWTNHEWLTELAFGVCYRFGGSAGLMLLRAVLLCGAVVTVGTILRRHRVSLATSLAIALFGMTVLAQFYRVRPQMFTYTGMAILLAICDAHRPGRRLGLCLIPLLIVAWTNLHAGFIAGLGIFGVYWLSFLVDAWKSDNRFREVAFLMGVMLAAWAATLINPYGIDYWGYVLFAVSLPRPEISEWLPITQQHPTVMACYAAAVVVPSLVWLRTCQFRHWPQLVTFLLGVFLAAEHGRHLPFLLLFAAVLLAVSVPEFQKASKTYTRFAGLDGIPARGFILGLLVLASVSGGLTKFARGIRAAEREGLLFVPQTRYPVESVDFLTQNQIRGNLDCGFGWGEYCLFKLHPACLVFCDGRYETVYPKTVADLALYEGHDPKIWRQRVDDFPTDLLLTPLDSPFADWAEQQAEFVEIHRDETARVLARKNPVNAELLRKWKAGELVPPTPRNHPRPFPA